MTSKQEEWIDIRGLQPEVGQVVLCTTYPELRVSSPEDRGKESYLAFKRYIVVSEYVGTSFPPSTIFDGDLRGFFKTESGILFNASHWLPLDVLPPIPD